MLLGVDDSRKKAIDIDPSFMCGGGGEYWLSSP